MRECTGVDCPAGTPFGRHRGVMCIKAETKEDVVKRLGRSPDKGDAVVMCWSRGDATMLGQIIPRDQRIGGLGGRMPKTVTSKGRGRMRKRRNSAPRWRCPRPNA